MRLAVIAVATSAIFITGTAVAADIPFNPNVTLKIGQTVVLKGVRGPSCGGAAPSWGSISGSMPKSKTGKFSAGPKGTVKSQSCGGVTPALAVRFTGKTKGSERFSIFGDGFSVTVK